MSRLALERGVLERERERERKDILFPFFLCSFVFVFFFYNWTLVSFFNSISL